MTPYRTAFSRGLREVGYAEGRDVSVEHRYADDRLERLADLAAELVRLYGPSLAEVAQRAATYVDKILKGARPADLPVEQPTRFELVINARTAKTLGVAIAPSLLARADDVIR